MQFYKGQWSDGQPETVSGGGSTLHGSQWIRGFLPKTLQKYNIKTFFDAPCGDRNWIKTIDFEGLDCEYFGGDIVEDIVKDSNLKSVSVFDIRNDTPPDVDLWLCRDCFCHFSEEDIRKATANMLDSGVRYALITSHALGSPGHNGDINTGGYRILTLSEYDYFGLGDPIEDYPDGVGSDVDKRLLMFDLEKARTK